MLRRVGTQGLAFMLVNLWVLSGLLLTLVGIGCGVCALRRTWLEHAEDSFLPDAALLRGHVRDLAGRIFPRLRERKIVSGDVGLVSTSEIGVAGALTVAVTPREGASADELIAHLLRRMERAERVADNDRAAAAAETAHVRADLTSVARRVDEEALRLETLTKSVAVGTVQLQIVGLILIGAGTVLMSVPSLLA